MLGSSGTPFALHYVAWRPITMEKSHNETSKEHDLPLV